MNTRIQQLADQAEHWADSQNFYESDYRDYLMEKFAELIVQECARATRKWYENHDLIHSDPMSYMLAHLGVEE